MINKIIENELKKYKYDIISLKQSLVIDCVTIFSYSEEDYNLLNNELKNNRLIDQMTNGNLYYLNNSINTSYGKLDFIKIRKYDEKFINYRISVDFVIDDFDKYKNSLINPVIKKYDTFELIQFMNDNSIINIISLSARDDYKLND